MTGVFVFRSVAVALAVSLFASLFTPLLAYAAEGNFSLQVTPSPLAATVKPGELSVQELKIRNGSTATENLKIEGKAFKIDNQTGDIAIDEKAAPEVAPWIAFSNPTFSVRAGEWFTQKISLNLPKESGFSYSFALVISRQDAPTAANDSGRLLQGSVAVFALINVDKPGATKSLDLTSFTTSRSLYEYLPTTFDIRLKNTGNTIIQPYGNIFVQRSSDSTDALATLPVNDAKSYLLPNTERTLSATWADGFPVYQQSTNTSGQPAQSLKWNIDQITSFRFGRYTAKVVAVYNDGIRDVPITAEVSFWVIPWRAILILIVSVISVIILFAQFVKLRTRKAVKKALEREKSIK